MLLKNEFQNCAVLAVFASSSGWFGVSIRPVSGWVSMLCGLSCCVVALLVGVKVVVDLLRILLAQQFVPAEGHDLHASRLPHVLGQRGDQSERMAETLAPCVVCPLQDAERPCLGVTAGRAVREQVGVTQAAGNERCGRRSKADWGSGVFLLTQ